MANRDGSSDCRIWALGRPQVADRVVTRKTLSTGSIRCYNNPHDSEAKCVVAIKKRRKLRKRYHGGALVAEELG